MEQHIQSPSRRHFRRCKVSVPHSSRQCQEDAKEQRSFDPRAGRVYGVNLSLHALLSPWHGLFLLKRSYEYYFRCSRSGIHCRQGAGMMWTFTILLDPVASALKYCLDLPGRLPLEVLTFLRVKRRKLLKLKHLEIEFVNASRRSR